MLMHVEFWILEAAFRSLLMALAVWAGIRILRVQAVIGQKIAWVLVLLAAGTMPLMMHAPWLSLNHALRIPVRPFAGIGRETQRPSAGGRVSYALPSETIFTGNSLKAAKPTPVHSATRSSALLFRPQQTAAQERLLGSDSQVPPVIGPTSTSSVVAGGSGAGVWSWARIKTMLEIVYLAVGGVLLLRTLAGLAIAFRIWRRSVSIADFENPLPTRRVRISHDLATPVTIGSTVILPAKFGDWDLTKLRIVLAHEGSHVRQGDFYLQLLAAVHTAVFWFSPMGWWLQRKLSELGEALSDRAGLEQAPDAASYAQVLLEFAAMPRTGPLSTPLVGVAMARTNNLSSRIERIVNARRFRLAFLGGRRRNAFLAAALVPAAWMAAVAGVRIVPVVEAAVSPRVSPITTPATAEIARASASGHILEQVSEDIPDQVASVDVGQVAPPTPAIAPIAPNPPSADIEPVQAPEPVAAPEPSADIVPVPPKPPTPVNGFAFGYSDGGKDSFAIIHGNDGSTVSLNGHSGDELEKVRQKYHGDFLWFERDGRSYIITDPTILARSESIVKESQMVRPNQEAMNRMQEDLRNKIAEFQPEIDKASRPGPEFQAQMAKLNAELAEIQSEKFKKLTEQITLQINQDINEHLDLTDETIKELSEQKLNQLQDRISTIQEQIGKVQESIVERPVLTAERQKEMNEAISKIGEKMGRLGEKQGKMVDEKVKSILDEAIRDGKAKPVE